MKKKDIKGIDDTEDLDNIEEELKEKDSEEDKTHQKVSGKSVFELQKIIIKKSDTKYESNTKIRKRDNNE